MAGWWTELARSGLPTSALIPVDWEPWPHSLYSWSSLLYNYMRRRSTHCRETAYLTVDCTLLQKYISLTYLNRVVVPLIIRTYFLAWQRYVICATTSLQVCMFYSGMRPSFFLNSPQYYFFLSFFFLNNLILYMKVSNLQTDKLQSSGSTPRWTEWLTDWLTDWLTAWRKEDWFDAILCMPYSLPLSVCLPP